MPLASISTITHRFLATPPTCPPGSPRGADPREWQTPEFAAALHALRHGAAVTLPGGKGRAGPSRYLVVEHPFGRARPETAASIDWAIYLDIPLDVAIVRKIRRDVTRYTHEVENAAVRQWIEDFCAF